MVWQAIGDNSDETQYLHGQNLISPWLHSYRVPTEIIVAWANSFLAWVNSFVHGQKHCSMGKFFLSISVNLAVFEEMIFVTGPAQHWQIHGCAWSILRMCDHSAWIGKLL